MDLEKIFSVAESIFFELSPENLSTEKMSRLQEHPSKFFIEARDVFSDWSGLFYEELLPDEYVEIWFFLDLDEQPKVHLAKMLLSLDDDDKDCHVDWY